MNAWNGTKFAFLIITCWLLSDLAVDPDLFARLAVGRLITDLAYLPLQDPFSFAPKNHAWVDHEWLSGLIFFRVWNSFGDLGLFVFKILLMLLSVLTLERASYSAFDKPARGRTIFFIVLAFGAAVVWRSTVRSQVFTYLGLPLTLLAICEFRKQAKTFWLYFLALYFLLWANCHGGFVVGLGFLGIFTCFESLRLKHRAWPVVLAFLAAIAATLINPYPGVLYWDYILHAVSMSRPAIPEWQAVNLFSHPALLPALTIVIFVTALLRGWRPGAFALIILAISAYQGFAHERLMPIFLMTSAVFGTGALAHYKYVLTAGLEKAFRLVAISIIILTTLCLVLQIGMGKLRLDYSEYPVAALDFLAANQPGGKLVTSFNHGSYALWKLSPRFQIAIDGRYEELYPEQTIKTVMDLYWGTSDEQLQAFKILNPHYVLVEKPALSIQQLEIFGQSGKVIFEDEFFRLYQLNTTS